MNRTYELDQFFGIYLGQDFPEDYGTWENAVRSYAREFPPDRVRFVRGIFVAARDSTDPEREVQVIFREARHGLPTPPYGFSTSRGWLIRMIELIDDGLKENPG